MKERLIRFWVYGILRQFQKKFFQNLGVGESKEGWGRAKSTLKNY